MSPSLKKLAELLERAEAKKAESEKTKEAAPCSGTSSTAA